MRRALRPGPLWMLAALAAAAPSARAAEASGAAAAAAGSSGEARARYRAIIVSFENDKFFAGTDRHYTQGGRVTFLYDGGPQSRFTTGVRNALSRLRLDLTAAKLSVAVGQDMFTPTDTGAAALIRDDRPYAAWAYLACGFHVIDDDTSFIAELSTGMVGPAAQGERLQNWWHEVIDVEPSQGWSNQLHNEPGLNLALEWRKRIARTNWFDAVPRAALVLGNVHTHLSAGGTLRFGPGLPNDFGHDLIRAGSGNVEPGRPGFHAYAFVSADARGRAEHLSRRQFVARKPFRAQAAYRRRPQRRHRAQLATFPSDLFAELPHEGVLRPAAARRFWLRLRYLCVLVGRCPRSPIPTTRNPPHCSRKRANETRT